MERKTFIIAEAGNLHNGKVRIARSFIREASVCRADAIKFQTHIFSAESLNDAPNPPYFKAESRKGYFERTAFSLAEWKQLKKYADSCGIELLSSVFSIEAVRLMEKVGVRIHKVPSGEVNNTPLLECIAKTRKPVFISCGMSYWRELDAAIKTLKNYGKSNITILQCSSIYPCPPEKVGLNVLLELKKRYGLAVGLSDHTLGCASSVAAIALGAVVIEKHFTLSRNLYGSDAKHSLEPDAFKAFVKEIRDAQKALDYKIDKDKAAKDLGTMKIIFEKSIVANKLIKKGNIITFSMLGFKKPGDGIKADRYKAILGKTAKVDILPDTKIIKEMLG